VLSVVVAEACRGPELFTPRTSGDITPNGALRGPQIVVEQVVAQDVNHLLRQLQDRARTRSLGSLNPRF
jgi:hypothetical protein